MTGWKPIPRHDRLEAYPTTGRLEVQPTGADASLTRSLRVMLKPLLLNTTGETRVRLRGKKVGSFYRDSAKILVHEDVLDEILDHSQGDLSREVGGFLIGHHREEPQGWVEICHFLPAENAQSGVASLRFTHETWSALNRQVAQQYPDLVVVGWQHTHPNLGVFLSGYDRFIHRNFFSEKWQVAMVVDPVRGEYVFFQWRHDEIVDCGFILVRDSAA